jgi:wyosine [tRNA(Phe)-imidazoG37] synthetase (radical SAM superfamily)
VTISFGKARRLSGNTERFLFRTFLPKEIRRRHHWPTRTGSVPLRQTNLRKGFRITGEENLEMNPSVVFGPVPSRRLGRSLGLNTIPPKICSYSCVYCQLGQTIKMQVERQPFYAPERIVAAVQRMLPAVNNAQETVDYLTFVPDGEPTLDASLGQVIDLLRPIGIPIAVITNSSLLWQQDVKDALMKADWVSLKVDTVETDVWRNIDHPHRQLDLSSILNGALSFAKAFPGTLVTETMLVEHVNDSDLNMEKTADFIKSLQPATAYLSIPIRPPADQWVRAPNEHVLNRAYQIFAKQIKHVEYLTGYEGNTFACTGDVKNDILSITAVHPMRRDALEAFLKKADENWEIIEQMVKMKQLIEAVYQDKTFYLRRFRQLSIEEH